MALPASSSAREQTQQPHSPLRTAADVGRLRDSLSSGKSAHGSSPVGGSAASDGAGFASRLRFESAASNNPGDASSTNSHTSTSARPNATVLRSFGGSNRVLSPSRSTSFTGLGSSSSSSVGTHYPPLVVSDVIIRANGDLTRALEDVVAERNKVCLEIEKVSSENMRIWNLMGRIRKENDALKSRLHDAAAVKAGSQPLQPPGSPSRIPASASSVAALGLASPPPVPRRRMSVSSASQPGPSGQPASSTASQETSRKPVDPASGNRLREASSANVVTPNGLAPTASPVPSVSLSAHPDQGHPESAEARALLAGAGHDDDVKQPLISAAGSSLATSVMQQRAAAIALQQSQGLRLRGVDDQASSLPASDLSPSDGNSHSANNDSYLSSHDYVGADSSSSGTVGSAMRGAELSSGDTPAVHFLRNRGSNLSLRNRDSHASLRDRFSQASPSAWTEQTVSPPPEQPASPPPKARERAVSAGVPASSSSRTLHAAVLPSTLDRSPSSRVRGGLSQSQQDPASPSAAVPLTNRQPGTVGQISPPGSLRKPSRLTLEPRRAVTTPGTPPMGGLSLAQALSGLQPNNRASAGVPHLDRSLLKQVNLRVDGSNIRNSDKGKEVSSFYVTIELKGQVPMRVAQSWKIEKLYSDVLALDGNIKHRHGKAAVKKLNAANAQVPDKALFKDHAPSKVDARKMLLETYLKTLLTVSLPDKDELCVFLCTDVVPDRPRDPNSMAREGWLTKKGQNLGRWVTRFYVLDGTKLDYFEGRGGALVGSINIKGAQIGRQQQSAQNDMDENSYRHAFLILEKRLPASSDASGDTTQLNRHVLCADSDKDRDEWVEILVRTIAKSEKGSQIAADASQTPSGAGANPSSTQRPRIVSTHSGSRDPLGRGVEGMTTSSSNGSLLAAGSTDSPTPQSRIKRSGSLSRRLLSREGQSNSMIAEDASGSILSTAPSGQGLESQPMNSTPSSSSRDRLSMRPSISGPMGGAPIPTGYKFGAKDEPTAEALKRDDKKRFWHRFGGGAGERTQSRPVFGVPLSDAVASSSVTEGLALPAVVYRCIEYLEKKGGVQEEGIYRMSGSSATIKGLRERFDIEGDVDLVNDKEGPFDPHAVAGLLKTYLRELPTSILTREMHLEFIRVNEITDWKQRTRELSELVSNLPLSNYTLLRTLCGHLIRVISHQKSNKMTMKNVGIVFSPTLGIPAGIFILFLNSFDYCFYTDANAVPEGSEQDDGPLAEATAGMNHLQVGGNSATSSSGDPRRRSNRNSLQYSVTDADYLFGGPMGEHGLKRMNPADPESALDPNESTSSSSNGNLYLDLSASASGLGAGGPDLRSPGRGLGMNGEEDPTLVNPLNMGRGSEAAAMMQASPSMIGLTGTSGGGGGGRVTSPNGNSNGSGSGSGSGNGNARSASSPDHPPAYRSVDAANGPSRIGQPGHWSRSIGSPIAATFPLQQQQQQSVVGAFPLSTQPASPSLSSSRTNNNHGGGGGAESSEGSGAVPQSNPSSNNGNGSGSGTGSGSGSNPPPASRIPRGVVRA